MSGENVSDKEQIVIDKVKDLDTILEEYLNNKSVGPKAYGVTVHIEAEPLLQMKQGDIRRMDAQECGEAAFVLGRLAIALTSEYNSHNARVGWCVSQINKVIADQLSQYKDYSYEAKKIQAVKHNDYARKLNDVRIQAEVRRDALAYLSKEVQFLASTLETQKRLKNDETRYSQ